MGTRKRKDVYTLNLSCNLETKFRGNKYLSIIISFLAFPLFLGKKNFIFETCRHYKDFGRKMNVLDSILSKI